MKLGVIGIKIYKLDHASNLSLCFVRWFTFGKFNIMSLV